MGRDEVKAILRECRGRLPEGDPLITKIDEAIGRDNAKRS